MDHYATLGLTESATAEEIKKSYKDLAKKYHPDLNGGGLEYENKFKEVSAAYDVLGNQTKKDQYDNERKFGQNGFFHQHQFRDINDIINMMMRQHAQPVKNRDITIRLNISLEDAYYGKSVPIQFNSTNSIKVDIPAGIANGQHIKFAGYGDKSNSSLQPGDLIVQIQVNDDEDFKRIDDKLFKLLDVDAIYALIGTEIEITCIDKSKIKLKIPAGIQHGTNLNVPKKGMPNLNDPKSFGELIIGINLTVPTLSEKVKKAIKKAYEEESRTKK